MYDRLKDAVWECELPETNWKFVLVAILKDSDNYGFSETSIDRISTITGLTMETVHNAIEGLKSKGIIIPAKGTRIGQEGFEFARVGCSFSPFKTPQISS